MDDINSKKLMEHLWSCGFRYFSEIINNPTENSIKNKLRSEISYMTKSNIMFYGHLPYAQRLYDIIFCPFKDIPRNLYEEGLHQAISAWRLKEGI